MLLFLHIPPTALTSICLSRKSSNLSEELANYDSHRVHLFSPFHEAGVLGTRWQWCMRMAMATMHASLSLPFESLSRRTRQFPPTTCTASPDSVRLANAATLSSVKDQKCKIQPIYLFKMQCFISFMFNSNVATGGRGISVLLALQMPPLYPHCSSSPRTTKVFDLFDLSISP